MLWWGSHRELMGTTDTEDKPHTVPVVCPGCSQLLRPGPLGVRPGTPSPGPRGSRGHHSTAGQGGVVPARLRHRANLRGVWPTNALGLCVWPQNYRSRARKGKWLQAGPEPRIL